MNQSNPQNEDENPLPEDISPEMPEAEPAAEAQAADPHADPLAAAQAKIAQLEQQMAEIKDQALRALAEADNIRKRAERAKEDTAKFAVSSFARELLSVADNLRRALVAIPEEARKASDELDNIYTGVEATERELLRAFESNGIKKIEPIGEMFNPNFHEVMFESPAPGTPPGTVMHVLEPGYIIHERLLRPARVGVAKGEEGEGEPGQNVNQEV